MREPRPPEDNRVTRNTGRSAPAGTQPRKGQAPSSASHTPLPLTPAALLLYHPRALCIKVEERPGAELDQLAATPRTGQGARRAPGDSLALTSESVACGSLALVASNFWGERW